MLDKIIILIYFTLLLVVGIYYKSHSNIFNHSIYSQKRKLLLIATIFASSVGGGTIFGITQKAFLGDIIYTYGLILSTPIDFLIARYVLPKIIKYYGSETVGDIIYKHYGLPGKLIAGITTIIVSTGILAAQINVSGHIFQYMLNVNFSTGVMISYSVVIIYTTIGGFNSILFTNLLQFFFMILAIPIITIFALEKVSLSYFINNINAYSNAFNFYNKNLIVNTISTTLSFSVMVLYPNFIQRSLINIHHKETSKAIYSKLIIYIVFLMLITINGLVARMLYSGVDSTIILPYLIQNIIPTGFKGLVIVGLLAATMSTADSDLNIISLSLVKDILIPIFCVKDHKKILLITKIVNLLIGVIAILIAVVFRDIIDLIVFIAGFWSPIIVVPLVFLLFNIVITKRNMLCCSIIGGVSFLIWECYFFKIYPLKGVFIGTVANFCTFLLIIILKKCRSF